MNVVGELQTVEVGETAAVNIVPRMLAIKDALEGKHHVIRIQSTGGSEPGSLLKLYVTTQMEAVGCAVIQHLPAFGQLRHQSIGVRVDIKQSVIQLSRQRVDDQTAARFLWIERIDLPTDAIDKAAVTNISVRGLLRRSSSLTTQKSSHHDQR